MIFEISTTGVPRKRCWNLIMATLSRFTPCFSCNRQKIKKLSILINIFKKASTQTKPENSKSECSEIIIYDLEKTYKDYDIFSTMYKRKKIFIPPSIFLFFYFIAVFQRVNHTQNLLINNEKS